jgi:ABC-type lipoprotein export system ATPase subunit
VLLVTHDVEAAELADRCCTLRDGKLINGHPDSDRGDPLAAMPRAPAAPA